MDINDILASIDAQANEYKKQARKITQANKGVINQQYDTANAIAEMQAREQKKLAQDQLTGLLDANAVDEAVARRNTRESLENMGLTKSGLNETSQTAISVMRGNADSKARQSVSDAVMSLSNQLAAIKAENESKRYGALAEQDIALAQQYQKADQNALANQTNLFEQYAKAQSSSQNQSTTDKNTLDRIDKNLKWAEEQNTKYGTNYGVDQYGNITKDGNAVVTPGGVIEGNGTSQSASAYALTTLKSLNPNNSTGLNQAIVAYTAAADYDRIAPEVAKQNIKDSFVSNGSVNNPAAVTDGDIMNRIVASVVTAPNGTPEHEQQVEQAAYLCNYLDLYVPTPGNYVSRNLYPTIPGAENGPWTQNMTEKP